MAVSWSFTLVLVLTVVALLTLSQPLFQFTPAAEVRHTREDLERAPIQNLPNFKASDNMGGSQRDGSARKVIQSGKDKGLQGICKGKRKTILKTNTSFRTMLTTRVVSETHPPAARNVDTKIPRRSVSTHFESDRMVPTGPNPLHNNNRSQVIFP